MRQKHAAAPLLQEAANRTSSRSAAGAPQPLSRSTSRPPQSRGSGTRPEGNPRLLLGRAMETVAAAESHQLSRCSAEHLRRDGPGPDVQVGDGHGQEALRSETPQLQSLSIRRLLFRFLISLASARRPRSSRRRQLPPSAPSARSAPSALRSGAVNCTTQADSPMPLHRDFDRKALQSPAPPPRSRRKRCPPAGGEGSMAQSDLLLLPARSLRRNRIGLSGRGAAPLQAEEVSASRLLHKPSARDASGD
ncbi:unnamed protein product [Symbiodinium natans]|uniref:Uncharacterized protein n=1 Tax=Symbiodinium natans TaxID=878477 RepID=A0A812MUF2_9DINO|nr:unnamed protein product [Symbiodinium natans]